MSDEVWASMKAKIVAAHKASQHLPQICPDCLKALSPIDIGVDPDTNIRTWLTYCCKKTDYYEEKISEVELKLP